MARLRRKRKKYSRKELTMQDPTDGLEPNRLVGGRSFGRHKDFMSMFQSPNLAVETFLGSNNYRRAGVFCKSHKVNLLKTHKINLYKDIIKKGR